jgi:hypothetical protein
MKKQTNYGNIYWIPKGFEFHPNLFSEKDGYIWYNEIEEYGSEKIHNTPEEANEELQKYCDEILNQMK